MILYLLFEFYNPTSFWAPFFPILPRDFSHLPSFWSETDLNELQSLAATFKKMIDTDKQLVKATYERAASLMESRQDIFPRKFTEAEWNWATLIFRTRSFSNHKFADKYGITNCLAPVADLFNHGGSSKEELTATNFTWIGEAEEDLQFAIYSGRSHEKGNEVSISYAPYWNTGILLFKYGFVPRGGAYPVDWVDTTVPLLYTEDINRQEKYDYIQELKILPTDSKFESLILVQSGLPLGSLAALRIGQLTPPQWETLKGQNKTAKSFLEVYSLENEWAALTRVIRVCTDMLSSFTTSAEQDNAMLSSQVIDQMAPNTILAIAYRKYVKDVLINTKKNVYERWASFLPN